ncbi:hypothetical protein V8E36_006577 [Tilletia maclaganii]
MNSGGLASDVFRECGLHERFSVARTKYGSPPVITWAAVLTAPAPDPEPILSHLRARVDYVLGASFAFSSIIAQGDSHRPRVARLKPVPTSKDIVSLRESIALDNVAAADVDGAPGPAGTIQDEDEEKKVVNSLRRLRNRCMTAEERLRIDESLLSISDRTLWNVALYPVTSTEEAKSYFVLTATFNHIIADGKGTFNVFNALLSRADPAPDPSDPTAPSAPSDQAFDVTIEPEADALPQDEETKAAPFWPQSVLKNLLECPVGLRTVDLDAAFSTKLKAVAKQHSVKTLHPVFEAAVVIALDHAVASVDPAKGPNDDGSSHSIITSTAISVRGSSLSQVPVSQHGHYGGNWVGGREGRVLCKPALRFWDLARHIADQLGRPQTLKAAMSLWKGLQFLPASTGEALVDPPQKDAVDELPLEADGWAHKMREFVGATPGMSSYTSSVGLSNLGFFPLDREADDPLFSVSQTSWTQVASPIGQCLVVNIVGSGRSQPAAAHQVVGSQQQQQPDGIPEGSVTAATALKHEQPVVSKAVPDLGGISFAITYRRGSVDEDILHRFESYLRDLLLLLAAGDIDADADVTSIRPRLS